MKKCNHPIPIQHFHLLDDPSSPGTPRLGAVCPSCQQSVTIAKMWHGQPPTGPIRCPANIDGVAQLTEKPVEARSSVLVLRTCNADGTSHNGFRWPLEVGAVVEAPDWRDDAECGGGLHGWLWGSGDWSLRSRDANRVWMVLEVDERDVRDLGGKVKFPRCTIAYTSKDWASAMAYIRGAAVYIERFAAKKSATGNYGHASATGNYGHASATGNYGHASATGHSGHASATGDSGCAVAIGDKSRVRCGGDGFIAAAWRDASGRSRLLVGYAGEDGIKAGQWYHVNVTDNTAKFMETSEDNLIYP